MLVCRACAHLPHAPAWVHKPRDCTRGVPFDTASLHGSWRPHSSAARQRIPHASGWVCKQRGCTRIMQLGMAPPHMAARALAHLPRKSASPRHARGYIYATRLHAHRASRHRFLIWQLEPMLLCRPTAHLLYASAWADTPDVCTRSTWIHYIAVKAHAQLCRECVRIPLLRTCVGVCQEVTRASCLSTRLSHTAA